MAIAPGGLSPRRNARASNQKSTADMAKRSESGFDRAWPGASFGRTPERGRKVTLDRTCQPLFRFFALGAQAATIRAHNSGSMRGRTQGRRFCFIFVAIKIMVPHNVKQWYHRSMDTPLDLLVRTEAQRVGQMKADLAKLKAADKRRKADRKAEREFRRAFTPNKHGEYT